MYVYIIIYYTSMIDSYIHYSIYIYTYIYIYAYIYILYIFVYIDILHKCHYLTIATRCLLVLQWDHAKTVFTWRGTGIFAVALPGGHQSP